MKILIVRLSSIGDCVLASPVVEALQERYPAAHLTWAVQSKSLPVVRGLPGLADILLWNDHHRWRSLGSALWRTWRERFDIVLDLQGLDKAGLFSIASGAKRRVSGTRARNIAHWSSNELVPEPEIIHARLVNLRRAAQVGIAEDAAERFYPRVPVTSTHRRAADEFLAQAGFLPTHRVVGLNLGAAHAFKRWPIERFAQLANELLVSDGNTRLIIFGAPSDMPLLEEFETELARCQPAPPGMSWPGRIVAAVGRIDLMQLASIAERCSAFVTADTGPMHIAAAIGAPVVALFGPTDSTHTGPVYKPGNAPIRVLDAREIVEDWPAPMDALKVELVFDEVRALMQQVEEMRSRA
ncbi:MAG: glycosyltransferase family 9 protein [Abitibacteriaceae bacterium]|nr:glycosyltransferase family 9 protein [Abditibacteriaceae bacterium]